MPKITRDELFSTYSIVAIDKEAGQIGGAVQTHQMSVGRIIPWMEPGIGAVASQSLVNISFSPIALAMLKEDVSPENIIRGLIASDPNEHRRQVAVINAEGVVATHTGSGCIPYASHYIGDGYSVQANMMTNDRVIPAMQSAFENSEGDLAQRMMTALIAAQGEDGDIRGMQSAALKVIPNDRRKRSWESVYDLRVDDHENPVAELSRLVRLRHAQLQDSKGYEALANNDMASALIFWESARAEAPELEEIGYWQALTLADQPPEGDSLKVATAILKEVLDRETRREHWVDLAKRLDAVGLMDRATAVEELLEELQQ